MESLKRTDSKSWWNTIKELTGRTKKESNMQAVANSFTQGDLNELACKINVSFASVSSNIEPITSLDSFTIGNSFDVADRHRLDPSLRYNANVNTIKP